MLSRIFVKIKNQIFSQYQISRVPTIFNNLQPTTLNVAYNLPSPKR